MATFQQRLLSYYENQKSPVQFWKKKIKLCSEHVARVYHKEYGEVVEMINSTEGDFQVNNYPDKFTPTIDSIILKWAEWIKKHPSVTPVRRERIPPPLKKIQDTLPADNKLPRKRTPIRKPVYSTKHII